MSLFSPVASLQPRSSGRVRVRVLLACFSLLTVRDGGGDVVFTKVLVRCVFASENVLGWASFLCFLSCFQVATFLSSSSIPGKQIESSHADTCSLRLCCRTKVLGGGVTGRCFPWAGGWSPGLCSLL